MPKYYSAASKGIVDYPEEAAALFDDLKLVPSEKHTAVEVSEPAKVEISKKDEKDAK
jgi:hypothetical protein